MHFRRRKQAGNVFGSMLTVSVERNDRICAVRERPLEPRRQRSPLASIAVVAQQGHRQSGQRVRRAIARAVVDDGNLRTVRKNSPHQLADRAPLVVCRDYNN
jgi:hypothetical protein